MRNKHSIFGRMRISSLRMQLILSFMIVSIFVLALNSLVIYKSNIGIMEKLSRENTIQTFLQMEQNIDDFISEVDNMAKLLMTSKAINDYLNDNNISELSRTYYVSDFLKITSNYFVIYKQIESVFVIKSQQDFIGNSRVKTWNFRYGTEDRVKFFDSDLYHKVGNGYSNAVLLGSTSSDEFLLQTDADILKPRKFITLIRKIAPLRKDQQPALLVVNINEKNLNNIYSRLSNKNNSVFIVNEKGITVSHSDMRNIGNKIKEYQSFDNTNREGNFIHKDGKTTEKVTYYRMAKTGWIMVNKISFSEFTKNTVRLQIITVVVMLLSLLMIFILYSKWLGRIMVPFFGLVKVMKEVERGNLGLVVPKAPNNEIGTVITQFNRFTVSIKELVENNKNIEEQKRILEVEFLQSQINPHFLYNTLNAIKWMAAMINARKIVDSITVLGNLIKPIFSQSDIFCTLEQEIEYTRNFKKIMDYRYDEDITLNIDVAEDLLNRKVLRFILQPLIENSFIHGFKQFVGEKTINIIARRETDVLVIMVSDNGHGISDDEIDKMNLDFSCSVLPNNRDKSGIGMSNVNKRIKLHFGSKYGIEVQKLGRQGTDILVRLPVD